jgi:polygalacturonase
MSCNGVVVDGVAIKNPIFGPNVEGIDISNSSNVRVANCHIETADDLPEKRDSRCVLYSTENIATRNIAVTNCVLSTYCNGFRFGTSSRGVLKMWCSSRTW